MPTIELTDVAPSLIASFAMCECASMMPGETNLPVPSTTSAPAGICTFVADRGDLAVAHDDGAVLDRAARDGHDRRVANRDDGRRGRPRLRLGASDEDRSSRDRGGGQCSGGDGKRAQMSADHGSLQRRRL